MSVLIEHALQVKRSAGQPWEALLRRFYRMAQRRGIRMVLGMCVAYLLLFHSPLLWVIAKPLRVSEPPRAADAIVVFAGGVGESGKAGGGYQERVKKAIDLYRQGMASRMIFSSGYTFVFKETEVMQELAIANGVTPSAILLETAATNTYDNVRFVEAMLRAQGWRSILLVSSPYNMRRATLTWKKAAPDLVVIPTPVASSQFYVHGQGASLEQIRGILHEYLGMAYYWWKGWIG